MEKQRNKVCGADIHKKFLVATLLSRDGTKSTGRFGMTLDEIMRFKEWVIENNCEQVAVESTGVYWVPIHTVLEDKIEIIVANAWQKISKLMSISTWQLLDLILKNSLHYF